MQALQKVSSGMDKAELEALRRYAIMGEFLERVLTVNVLEGSITATTLQRTSAKALSKLLRRSHNRLVIMHNSEPEMLLVSLKELREQLEQVRDDAIVMERKDGPWIENKEVQRARLHELGMLP